jgi:hypothetical protein
MEWRVWRDLEVEHIAIPATTQPRDAAAFAGGDLAQRGRNAGLALRHLLRMLAYDPAAARAPRQTLARLRPFVDGARRELDSRHKAGGTVEEYRLGLTLLTDGAVTGLCHVARFCADAPADSVVPPFAAIAGGALGRREPAPPAVDLLFLLPEDSEARERAARMVAFVLTGLLELGFPVNHVTCSPAAAVLLAEAVPFLMASIRESRFLWGRYGLYADLVKRLPSRG